MTTFGFEEGNSGSSMGVVGPAETETGRPAGPFQKPRSKPGGSSEHEEGCSSREALSWDLKGSVSRKGAAK